MLTMKEFQITSSTCRVVLGCQSQGFREGSGTGSSAHAAQGGSVGSVQQHSLARRLLGLFARIF